MIFVKQYAPPPVRMDEILRYAAAKGGGEDVRTLAQECLAEAEKHLSYQICYQEFSLTRLEKGIDLSFCKIESKTLEFALSGCSEILLFAATLGIGFDRLIARYSHTSPARAWILQAIGAERIEALCDSFCFDLKSEKNKSGKTVTPRVSPGYGDIPLAMQGDIFQALDCHRSIGLALNSSFIMTPTKSVTAIVGIKQESCYEHP